jgi:hypothetical protein
MAVASVRPGRLALTAALLLGISGEARAQAFVSSMCRGYVTPAEHFDSPEHSLWYKRFWTGDCDHLMACFPGSPNWNDIAAKLVARGAPAQRAALQPKACSLGERIGLEWSREHGVRRITTADLKRYHAMLDHEADPLRGLTAVENAVAADLKRSPPP